MNWRAMTTADITAVSLLGDAIYPVAFHESEDAVLSRLRLGFGLCRVIEDAGRLGGYLLAHHWDASVPKLDTVLEPVAEPTHIFVHDVALVPHLRGLFAARSQIWQVLTEAERLGRPVHLVALAGTQKFWRDFSFEETAPVDGYGVGATLMRLDAP